MLLAPQRRNELLKIGYLRKAPSQTHCSVHLTDCTITICDVSGVELQLIGGRTSNLLCFLMKSDSAVVTVIVVCWLERGQVSACNQPVYNLDTLGLLVDLLLEEADYKALEADFCNK